MGKETLMGAYLATWNFAEGSKKKIVSHCLQSSRPSLCFHIYSYSVSELFWALWGPQQSTVNQFSKLGLKVQQNVCQHKVASYPLKSAEARWHCHQTCVCVMIRVGQRSCQRDVASFLYSHDWSVQAEECSASFTAGLLHYTHWPQLEKSVQGSILLRLEFSKWKSQIKIFSLICVCISQNLVILVFWFDEIWEVPYE